MSRRYWIAALALVLAACGIGADAGAGARQESARRLQQFRQRLAEARRSQPEAGQESPVARWELPSSLGEISGLTITSDGRMFAHGDEGGDVFEVDFRTGLLVKRFALGPESVTEDFEAIVARDSGLSEGRLYDFAEGTDGGGVPWRTRSLALDGACREFEGAVVDPHTREMVLACKNAREQPKSADVLIYRVAADSAGGYIRVTVPLDSIRARVPGLESFSPSDLALRPDNGNYLMVAGPEKAYAEVTPTGAVVRARLLPDRHPQTEGIAVTRDGLLILADEAASRRATITVYSSVFQ
jgi:hypothetical protein